MDSVIMAIENYPEATYLQYVQENHMADIFTCVNQECGEEPILQCAKCMLALYCTDSC